ncbi:hypothetical protein BDV25DRAFT_57125 [Aspergillus avenaceus]|uniref:Uncharacterized protein n=1 Tax=Aspergillus avenaceus TaxID=36643 RepID=A0A5N6U204_ASPAV|nr:hypothetical protein BDV25DRAFT_57125 [Aspergillus avenaceus]
MSFHRKVVSNGSALLRTSFSTCSLSRSAGARAIHLWVGIKDSVGNSLPESCLAGHIYTQSRHALLCLRFGQANR